MARIITKELALKIANKLKAQVTKTGGAHDLAEVYLDGVLVASFGIRRSSEKDKGHDHIPGEIYVGPAFAKLLGQCPKKREDWILALQEKGIVPREEEAQEPEAGEP